MRLRLRARRRLVDHRHRLSGRWRSAGNAHRERPHAQRRGRSYAVAPCVLRRKGRAGSRKPLLAKGSPTSIRVKRRASAASRSNMCRYSASVGGPESGELAARQHRLSSLPRLSGLPAAQHPSISSMNTTIRPGARATRRSLRRSDSAPRTPVPASRALAESSTTPRATGRAWVPAPRQRHADRDAVLPTPGGRPAGGCRRVPARARRRASRSRPLAPKQPDRSGPGPPLRKVAPERAQQRKTLWVERAMAGGGGRPAAARTGCALPAGRRKTRGSGGAAGAGAGAVAGGSKARAWRPRPRLLLAPALGPLACWRDSVSLGQPLLRVSARGKRRGRTPARARASGPGRARAEAPRARCWTARAPALERRPQHAGTVVRPHAEQLQQSRSRAQRGSREREQAAQAGVGRARVPPRRPSVRRARAPIRACSGALPSCYPVPEAARMPSRPARSTARRARRAETGRAADARGRRLRALSRQTLGLREQGLAYRGHLYHRRVGLIVPRPYRRGAVLLSPSDINPRLERPSFRPSAPLCCYNRDRGEARPRRVHAQELLAQVETGSIPQVVVLSGT